MAQPPEPPDWSAEEYEAAKELVREMGEAASSFSLDDVHLEANRRAATAPAGNGGSARPYRMMRERHQVLRALANLERDGVLSRLGNELRWQLTPSPKPPRRIRLAYQGPASLKQGEVEVNSEDCVIEVAEPDELVGPAWNGRLAAPRLPDLHEGEASLRLPDGRGGNIRLGLVAPSGFCVFDGLGLFPQPENTES